MHCENCELHVFLAIVMRHDFFFKVNLGYRAIIVATAIQGRQDLNQWVTSYTLKYGDNGIRFRNYQSGRAGVRFFNILFTIRRTLFKDIPRLLYIGS